MVILKIELNEELMKKIKEGAGKLGFSEEKFIADILNRYFVDAHIMESKDVEEGYVECGAINLELAK